MKPSLSPSMMCADILEVASVLKTFEDNSIEYLHMDVMDGEFVPNYMFGTDSIKQMRKASNIPLDIHLMINEPESKLDWFDIQPNELVAIHAESTKHLQKALAQIRSYGARPLVAINPATPLSTIEEVLCDIDGVLVMTVNPGFAGQKLVKQTLAKITKLRKMLDEQGYNDVFIEVDGNVSIENAILMKQAGADIFVLGTSCLFKHGDLADRISDFRKEVF